ncbi:MAG: UvrD-helicase domain-containing protein [Candidatus Thiodiazotropha sp. (ex Epidulcina cf. delphinae)]|nr:UvrD-helicase domain-containing protein [Candidatus Thiodiazotropha sp. (ex Epidulcina cf. delphinae)]
MRILLYNEINPAEIPGFKKMKAYLEADDFRSAEVKKVGDNLYRARLDRSNRLLFAIHRYQGDAYALVLECIKQHAYEKSRFLNRGVAVDEAEITTLDALDEVKQEPLIYVNPSSSTFNMLDKIISFDEAQSDIYALQPPLIIIGSAGSGKTALTLEKMKEAVGDILYVTRSPYLVHNSRDLYYAAGYANEDQQIDFLSFQEYLESIHVPVGREMHFKEFSAWFARHRAVSGLKDAHQLFEEFKGVITGPATESSYLGQEEYLGLGVKQSIFSREERERVYDLFIKYLEMMNKQGFYDANVLSHEYLARVEPRYDFIVMDEVQDLTNVQMQLILKSLRDPACFILCGDSNQIVHPNFFSWSKIKSFFYRQEGSAPQADLIRILNTNYRNSPQVTEVANRVLKIKSARFGSIDKESNYLVASNAHNTGEVILLQDEEGIKAELDAKTRHSTRFAIIVMHPDDKAAAGACFKTPLVFSVQEAKGLEYENIVLYNFTSEEAQRFREITRGVGHDDLQRELTYARTKDKSDKSLEIYKFHINALYVAITRAVRNIYLIERITKQRLFDLLGLRPSKDGLQLEKQDSSLDEWRMEAQRLELQGKQEQAESIRNQILKQKPVPWEVLRGEPLEQLQHKAIEEKHKKAKITLFEYALVYRDQSRLNALIKSGFAPAKNPDKGRHLLNKKHYMPYELKHPGAVLRQTDQYGVDFRNLFNQTPLMVAGRLGNETLIRELRERGANTELINNAGFNAFLIAVEQALDDPKYSRKKLAAVYRLLEPDCLDIQVDERLIKLDKRSMEFLMLNLMMAMFYTRLGDKIVHTWGAFQSRDFAEALAHFPEHILPARRKKRPYISGILSKNEVSRDDKYNRKLFLRVKHGHYIMNPGLSLRVGGEWRNIFELLSFDMIAHVHTDKGSHWGEYDYNEMGRRHVARFADKIKRYAEQGCWNAPF